ncbi:MAG: hypothetical protein K0V04_42720 [Deltaproteobacteria bacterium]|nr:hypothetical protein [Deltaproteobacteria bacterium]
MDVVQQFDEETYDDEPGRVYPIDKYEIPTTLLKACRKYRFLKVPLMGQYFDSPTKKTQDWCGRTSGSMLYNYYELIKGGDPRSRYITHWDADQYSFLDLRLPNGERAFHAHPTAPPFDDKLSGVRVNGAITELWPHYREGKLLPFVKTKARLDQASAIMADESQIFSRFATVCAALDANNPLIIYSGLSRNRTKPGHLILIVGYAHIEIGGRETLWIAMADPSTTTSKIIGSNRGGVQFYRTPGPATNGGNDIAALSKLSADHNLIRIKNGAWTAQQGSLVLVRARTFFELNEGNEIGFDLLMDDFTNGRQGGTYLYSTTPTEVPDAVLVSSDRRSVVLPFDAAKEPRGPIAYLHDNETSAGGFYPLGLYRNVHSGAHLLPPERGLSPVHVAMAGQIVAVRLTGAVPGDVAQGQGDPDRPARAQELSGTSNAMVLVRHTVDLQPLPSAGTNDGGAAEKERSLTVYTLYLHLQVPDWNAPDANYADVPWLNALLRRRGGSLTVVDPDHEGGGGVYWPVDAGGQPLVEQGTFEVYGARFTDRSSATLGSGGGQVRAVAKPPDEDLQQTLQALADGKVVTFAPDCANMEVRCGELLGFIPDQTAVGSTFLHFEVLAPAGAGLSELVAFGQQRLGAEGLFSDFQEKTDNNYFDAGGTELDDLVGLLPDGGDGLHINNNYGPAELRALMRDGERLPFATEAKPLPDETLVYPSTLRLQSFRDSVPDGDYPVQLTFNGGGRSSTTQVTASFSGDTPAELTVMVPAWAESVDVASDDFHVQRGGPRPTQDEEVEHFSRVGGARWRNVKVTHLNEWSPDGLRTSMEARFKDAADVIEPLIDAMAWWGHDEEPVVGPEGAEPSLFVDGGEPYQLPKTCELEHLHPVMAMWMMDLLVRHGHAEVRIPGGRLTDVEDTPVGWAGWLPALHQRPALVVGDPVEAVAVSEASPGVASYGQVEIQAQVSGGPTVTLGAGPWERDLLRVGCPASWWGRSCVLSIPGASPQALGAPAVEVGTPVLDTAATIEPPKAQRGSRKSLTWAIAFADHCPRMIRGWVSFKAWVGAPGQPPPDVSAFTEVAVGIGVEAVRRGAESAGRGPVIEGGYVVRGPTNKRKYITKNFTWSEYIKAAGTVPDKVAEALLQGVQGVRTAYGSGIWLSSLAADGLSIRIKGASTERVLAKAQAQAQFASATKVGNGPWIEVSVAAPAVQQGTPGIVDVEFDPSAAYAAILDELSPSPSQQVHLVIGARFVNGGSLVDTKLAGVDAVGEGAVADLDWNALRAAAGGSSLELFASAPSAVLSSPAFGKPTWSISGRSLAVSVPLFGGDLAMWNNSAPKITVGKAKRGRIVNNSGAVEGQAKYLLTTTLDMKSSAYKAKALTIVAKVTKTGGTFGGAQVSIADSEPLQYDTTARVEAVTLSTVPADDPETLQIEAQTFGIPAANSLEVFFEAEGTSETDWKRVPVSYPVPDRWGSGRVTGKCDARGVFRASVSLESLHAVLRPDAAPRTFTVKVGRRWAQVLGQSVEAVSADSVLVPPPGEDGAEREVGPITGGMPEDND